MYVVATFQQNMFVEMVISELIASGVPENRILAIPMTQHPTRRLVMDTIHRSDGYNSVDLAAILGTVFMLLGAIYGYLFAWGPILWALIGAVSGFALGILIKLATRKIRFFIQQPITEVILLIHCEVAAKEQITSILMEHTALAVSEIPFPT